MMPMDVRQNLHQMINGLDDIRAAIVHDYLLRLLSREQDPELTPEEQAAGATGQRPSRASGTVQSTRMRSVEGGRT
jgi:hypothetical protein